jgi:hypothetical protein
LPAVLHRLTKKNHEGPYDPRERATHHAEEAERLLKSWWLSSHVKGQVHATLALYYSAKRGET